MRRGRPIAALGARVPLLEGRLAIGGQATAYVCRDRTCQLPVHTAEKLERQLAVR